MTRSWAVSLLAAVGALSLLAGCGNDADSAGSGAESVGEPGERFDARRADRDLRAQVRIGPRPAGSPASQRTARFIVRRLREADVDDVRVQSPLRNVVGRIPGTESGAVVIGAHHDTKDAIPGFVGANDGASGVAVVLELARALPTPVDGPTVHVALFDAEEARGNRPFSEDGARGARQYVRYARRDGEQGSPPVDEVRAMVLLDLVGDCDLEIPREANSDRRLYGEIEEAGATVLGDSSPFGGTTGPILDDHVPFAAAGIPAVDVIDFTFGPGPSPGSYWHTPEDTLDKVCPRSLDAVGETVLEALPQIGAG